VKSWLAWRRERSPGAAERCAAGVRIIRENTSPEQAELILYQTSEDDLDRIDLACSVLNIMKSSLGNSIDARSHCTRVEVIDGRPGAPRVRAFSADSRVEPPFQVVVSWQDNASTLKIFLSKSPATLSTIKAVRG
jgi:hypothetical protein